MSTQLEAIKKRRGKRLRSARLRAGLSHDRLAARIGTSRHHLIKLEKGQHLARTPLLEAIARETGVSVAYLEADGDDDEEEGDQPQMTLDDFLRYRVTEIATEVIAKVVGQ